MPGDIIWDALTAPLHFEFQAFCAAARLFVEEVVYIAARCADVPHGKVTKGSWEARPLMLDDPRTETANSAEVAVLRAHAEWFRVLNGYRNAFLHHGWRHGSGHADEASISSSAHAPERNALLLPDPESVKSHTKPFQWSWSKATRIDKVMGQLREEHLQLIGELCEGCWATPVPATGSVPIGRG